MKLDHLLIAHFLLTQNNTSLLQCWIHIQPMSMLTWCHANNTACSQCLFHWLHGHISHNGVPELRTEDKRLLISTNFTQSYFFSSVLHVLSFFFFSNLICRKKGRRWWKWRSGRHSKEDNTCQRYARLFSIKNQFAEVQIPSCPV